MSTTPTPADFDAARRVMDYTEARLREDSAPLTKDMSAGFLARDFFRASIASIIASIDDARDLCAECGEHAHAESLVSPAAEPVGEGTGGTNRTAASPSVATPPTERAAHTPGPWRATERERTDNALSYPWAIERVVGNAVLPVADVCAFDVRARQDANARLIAAAPILYDALVSMTRHYVTLIESGDAGNWDPEEEAPVKLARLALTAARSTTGAADE